MEIKVDANVSFPIELVFTSYRDRILELLPYLPNIRDVKILKREERDGDVHLVNEWIGGGDIPSVARAFLSESMLRWTDHAHWKTAARVCEWRTDVNVVPGALLSSGTNRFVETPSGTRIEFRGQLTCDSAKLPGVPRLMARTINGTVEKLFVGKVGENLVAVGKALEQLLRKDA